MKTPYDVTVVRDYKHGTVNGYDVLVSEWSDREYTVLITKKEFGLIDTLEDNEHSWSEYPSDDEIAEVIEEMLERRWDAAHP